ncbi:MAG: hypothetical protein LBT04_04325 [Prevotellaceae bacterium]|jgi:hypothetical protein|nr:hypothetical protein [Prevotellaceae bacterium]
MKTKHGLSGLYFRQKNTETGKIEPVVFEDMELEEQKKVLDNAPNKVEYYKGMIQTLADALYRIGEEMNIYSTMEKNEED